MSAWSTRQLRGDVDDCRDCHIHQCAPSGEYMRALGVDEESAFWQQQQVMLSSVVLSVLSSASVTEHLHFCSPRPLELT